MLIIWKRICCAVLLSVALAGLAGCGSHEAPVMNADAIRQALLDKTWTLEKVARREMESDTPLTLKFGADGTVEGFGGCNAFQGQYALDGEKLTFGPMASTRKSCGAAADEQEYTFLTYLAKVEKLALEGDELSLFTDNQLELFLTSGESGLLW
ncbi:MULTISPECIES: META domain-containing protein [unclassified Pseudodesulfovibrio]|uniref:META domain-containing protein n=1 Tax=unclassified Pseudodesulfovibrio TaxID=2661612 RepID=UPI000FEC0EE4|nr:MULTISPECIES: META domain-containing protein [unclassified Pseudodesulfovibrio]MCJ2165803.1 META domain-containing protein [Pseudodesulfovibrio sp. S3-i]RWU02762.1 META domain-containing protein [Pseudodesulfovibrio sp. S3]